MNGAIAKYIYIHIGELKLNLLFITLGLSVCQERDLKSSGTNLLSWGWMLQRNKMKQLMKDLMNLIKKESFNQFLPRNWHLKRFLKSSDVTTKSSLFR